MVHFDQGGEFKNSKFQVFRKEHGIMTHMTAAYTLMQNGTVKKANRTIGDAVGAMLTGGSYGCQALSQGNMPFCANQECHAQKVFFRKACTGSVH